MSMTGNKEQLIVYLLEQPKDKVFDLSEHREKRSLSANSYYQVLCDKISEAMKLPREEVHKQLLNDYGTWDYLEDGSPKWVILPKNKPLPPDGYYFDTKADVTVKGANSGEEQGHAYIVIRGSHTYNSKEMARLIDGAVQEAQNLGIETRTPAEIDEMIRLMEQK